MTEILIFIALVVILLIGAGIALIPSNVKKGDPEGLRDIVRRMKE